LKELIKFKNLIKLLMSFVDSIKTQLKTNQIWRPNSNQFARLKN